MKRKSPLGDNPLEALLVVLVERTCRLVEHRRGTGGDRSAERMCSRRNRRLPVPVAVAASFAAGAIGYVPWVFSYTQAAGSCSYNFEPTSPVMPIFRAF